MSGDTAQVRHPVRGNGLDGGYRTCHRFHSRKEPMVSRICTSTTPLSSDRRWRAMHIAACQCCRKPSCHVRIFLIPKYDRIHFTDQTNRIASIGLFLLTWKTKGPYRAHLLGIKTPPELLPFTLAYKKGDRPMFSDMSFKCQSTSTFSSYTLPEPHEDTLYTLYPTRPEKAYGLGIYAPKTSVASFLTPRPSLKTIRSQASFGHRPLKSSPVPPLPVHDPEKYKDMPAMQKTSLVPKRVYTLRRKSSQRGALRAVQCSPLPSGDKLRTLDRSASGKSLSSVYSRSVSGDSPELSHRSVFGKTNGRHLNASTASTTFGRNAPNVTRPNARFGQEYQPRSQSRLRQDYTGRTTERSSTRLPVVRAVSDLGNVQDWAGEKGNMNAVRSGRASTWSERCNLPPLPVETARMHRP
jgi:hypothetical protein